MQEAREYTRTQDGVQLLYPLLLTFTIYYIICIADPVFNICRAFARDTPVEHRQLG